MNINGHGWTDPFIKGGGSKFDKYDNQLVVIVSNAKNKYLYLSKATLTAMGNPQYIKLRARGSNIGLFTADNSSDGYTVQCQKKGDTPYISVVKFFNQYAPQPGAYTVHMEAGGVAVFDTQSAPSHI